MPVVKSAALSTVFGWALGLIGAASYQHLTASEVTLMLSVVGATVPVAVAFISVWGKRMSKTTFQALEADNRALLADNNRLRSQLRELRNGRT